MRADVYNDVGEVVIFFMILKGDEDELTTQLAYSLDGWNFG